MLTWAWTLGDVKWVKTWSLRKKKTTTIESNQNGRKKLNENAEVTFLCIFTHIIISLVKKTLISLSFMFLIIFRSFEGS